MSKYGVIRDSNRYNVAKGILCDIGNMSKRRVYIRFDLLLVFLCPADCCCFLSIRISYFMTGCWLCFIACYEGQSWLDMNNADAWHSFMKYEPMITRLDIKLIEGNYAMGTRGEWEASSGRKWFSNSLFGASRLSGVCFNIGQRMLEISRCRGRIVVAK